MQIDNVFFQEEERDGFVIAELMKRAWAAEMEVLQVLDEICQKNGITYFADWGTLLGAVRHKGFIPWDDDIDIALKRKDYNKLIDILPKELPDGFVMAGMYADDNRLQQACDVHQIRVMADEKYWTFPEYLKRFHGFPFYRIGIDIFPLDYIPADHNVENVWRELLNRVIFVLTHWKDLQVKGELGVHIQQLEETFAITVVRDGTEKLQLWRFFDGLCAMFGEEESEELANFIFYFRNPQYRLHKDWYRETVSLKFEMTEVPGPICYHEALSAMYGDYKIPVRVEDTHEYPFYKTQEQELEHIFRQAGLEISITEFCRNWMNLLH